MLKTSLPDYFFRLRKTPAFRTPSVKEPVYTFSANGSPLGGMDELFINLPAGDGKVIFLLQTKTKKKVFIFPAWAHRTV